MPSASAVVLHEMQLRPRTLHAAPTGHRFFCLFGSWRKLLLLQYNCNYSTIVLVLPAGSRASATLFGANQAIVFLSYQISTSTNQPTILFYHNKSASATSHSQLNRVVSSRYCTSHLTKPAGTVNRPTRISHMNMQFCWNMLLL